MDEYIADVKADMFQAFAKWEEILTDFGGWVRKKYDLTGSPAGMHAGAKALINSNMPKTCIH